MPNMGPASRLEQAFRATLPEGGRITPGDEDLFPGSQAGPGPDPASLAAPSAGTVQVPVAADVTWRRLGDPALRRQSTCLSCCREPGGRDIEVADLAIEDQLLAALADEPIPLSIAQILQKTRLHGHRDTVCRILSRLEQRGQVEGFTFLSGRFQYWHRPRPAALPPAGMP